MRSNIGVENPYKDYQTFYQYGTDCYKHLGFQVCLDKKNKEVLIKNNNKVVLNTYKNLIKGDRNA